jgi:hypothetical protein
MGEKKKQKNWWQKQKTEMKTTIVAGVFSLAVAICGISATLLSPIISNQLSDERITANVVVSAAQEKMGRGPILFARDSTDVKDNFYEILSNTCIEAKLLDYSDEWVIVDSRQDRESFDDWLYISVRTNIPVVIESIELRLVDFTPITSEKNFSLYYYDTGRFGGPGWARRVELNLFELVPHVKSYFVFHEKKYQLPENDVVVFYVPFISYKPGTYKIQTIAYVSDYDTPTQKIFSEEVIVKWINVGDVDLDTIQYDGDVEFRICE